MNLSTTLKTGIRAGIVALALGGTALVAAPVQAAQPNFGFQLNFGNGGFGNGGIVLHFGDDNYFDYCLTNSQIRSALRGKGYSQVKVVKESNSTNKVWVIYRDDGDWFQARVDRCTHKVDRVEEIYPHGPDNSFNLTFSF
jgi:hypothetical protein